MDNFNELLDEIETKIEEHRKLALRLVEDGKSYGHVLKTIEASAQDEDNELSEVDKEEIKAVLERLDKRLSSVEINLITHRNEGQKEALQKINEKIDHLVDMVEANSPEASKLAESYLNSCSKGTGSKFEALLLSCTSDDQKAVKEQIAMIVENLNAIMESEPANEENSK